MRIKKSRTAVETMRLMGATVRTNSSIFNKRRLQLRKLAMNPRQLQAVDELDSITANQLRRYSSVLELKEVVSPVNPVMSGLMNRLDARVERGAEDVNEMLAKYGITR